MTIHILCYPPCSNYCHMLVELTGILCVVEEDRLCPRKNARSEIYSGVRRSSWESIRGPTVIATVDGCFIPVSEAVF